MQTFKNGITLAVIAFPDRLNVFVSYKHFS